MDEAALGRIQLFEGLSRKQRKLLAMRVDEVDVPAGKVLCCKGKTADEFFVIEEGTAKVVRDGQYLDALGPGDFFGEMSLLEGLPRSATARAVGDVSLLVLRPGSLLLQIRRDPTFAFELLQQLSGRIRDLNEKLVFRLATAEFGNRLARAAFMQGVAGEYRSSHEPEDGPVAS